MNTRPHNRGRKAPRSTVAALTIALLLPAAIAAGAPASAQLDETLDETIVACEPAHIEHPLWVEAVEIHDASGSQAATLGFVEGGDEISFDVRVTNRVDPACDDPVYPRERTDDVSMRVVYLPEPDASVVHTLTIEDVDCPSGEAIHPGETCVIEAPLPDEVNTFLDHAGGGEQRVRFVVGDEGPCPPSNLDGEPGENLTECALAGAERVLVVDANPDLAIHQVTWAEPAPENRTTSYGGDSGSTFEVELANYGSYPAWSPNAGPGYATASSFDAPGDGDEASDETCSEAPCTYTGTETELPPCRWADDIVCSYRPGAALDIDVHHQLRRSGSEEVLEDRLHPGFPTSSSDERDDALLHMDHEGDDGTASVETEIDALDRFRRAGSFVLTTSVAIPVHGVPDADPTDNTVEDTHLVHGVDLRMADDGVVVLQDGEPLACGSRDAPCPPGANVRLDPTFANVGSDEDRYPDPANLLERAWAAGIHLKQGHHAYEIPLTQAGAYAVQNHSAVPATDDGEVHVFGGQAPVLSTHPDGGLHVLEVRLDHPSNYAFENPPVTSEEGLIAERTERYATANCSDQQTISDNTLCVPLWFEDTSVPTIGSTWVEDALGVQRTTVAAGELSVIHAEVEDNDLHSVEAIVERSDGTLVDRIQLEPDSEDDTLWIGQHRFHEAGELTYRIEAADSSHTVQTSAHTLRVLGVDAIPDPGIQALDVHQRAIRDGFDPGLNVPWTGREVNVNVANDGPGAMQEPATLLVTACPGDGPLPSGVSSSECELIAEHDVPALTSQGTVEHTDVWDTSGKIGRFHLCATVIYHGVQQSEEDDQACEAVEIGASLASPLL